MQGGRVSYREIESHMEATANQDAPEDLTPETEDAFVAPEVREQKRLSRKPSIDHLKDEELQHYACMAFDRPDVQRIKLPPKKGNPFRAPKATDGKPLQNSSVSQGDSATKRKGRGRPKGSKNRPKEEIRKERLERREAKKR